MKILKPVISEMYLINKNEKKIDVYSIFKSFTIFQDLFSPVMNATLVIEDGDNILSDFDIIGEEEYMVITFRGSLNSENDVFLKFAILSISREQVTIKNHTVTIELVSEEIIKSKAMVFNKLFSGNVKTLVTSLLSEIESPKTLEVEESSNVIKYIPANLSPFEIISALLPRITSDINPNSKNQIFYENSNGFHLKSIDYIFEKSIPKEFIYKDGYSITDESEILLNNILFFKIDEAFDKLNKLNSGYYGSITKVIDLDNRNLDVIDNRKSSNSLSIEKNGKETKVKTTHTKVQVKPINDNRENIGKRYADLSKITNSIKCRIECPGNSELNVGDVIVTALPNAKDKVDNNYFSGKFLITALTHSLEKDNYTTTCEIIKDEVNVSEQNFK